ncbi:hypothetical protein [Parasutterella sp.]|uniref:hypothetical protein n=1 Tax=Parasutterella sp. TaxID=2049037 RepID=UPI003520C1E0
MLEPVIKKIDDQSKKAALIIDHVRNYAKNKERNKIPVDLCQVSKETLNSRTRANGVLTECDRLKNRVVHHVIS